MKITEYDFRITEYLDERVIDYIKSYPNQQIANAVINNIDELFYDVKIDGNYIEWPEEPDYD